jgi:hypothetical protein
MIVFGSKLGEEGTVPLLLKLLLPAIVGGLAASVTMYGVVYSQTKAPDTNPASQPILVYGDQS